MEKFQQLQSQTKDDKSHSQKLENEGSVRSWQHQPSSPRGYSFIDRGTSNYFKNQGGLAWYQSWAQEL